jgi:hypothetical protein
MELFFKTEEKSFAPILLIKEFYKMQKNKNIRYDPDYSHDINSLKCFASNNPKFCLLTDFLADTH